jgi:hypothetical protein
MQADDSRLRVRGRVTRACVGVTADTPSYPFVIEGCDRDGAEIDNTTLLAIWRSSMPIPAIAFAPPDLPPSNVSI